jgi:hypothetical protein
MAVGWDEAFTGTEFIPVSQKKHTAAVVKGIHFFKTTSVPAF